MTMTLTTRVRRTIDKFVDAEVDGELVFMDVGESRFSCSRFGSISHCCPEHLPPPAPVSTPFDLSTSSTDWTSSLRHFEGEERRAPPSPQSARSRPPKCVGIALLIF